MFIMKKLRMLLAAEDKKVIWDVKEKFNKKVENFVIDIAITDISLMNFYKPDYYDFILADTSLTWCREKVAEIRAAETDPQKKWALIIGLFREEKDLKNKKELIKHFRPFYKMGFNEIFCFPLSSKEVDIILERYGPY